MAKNDFLLNIGFKIDSTSIKKGALRAALTKAAEGLTLNISKVKLANPQQMRKDIARQLGSLQLSSLSVSRNAAESLARSIQDKTKPTIKSLTVNPTSLANLRKSVERALANVSVTVKNLPGGSGGGQSSSSSRRGETTRSNTRATNQNTASLEQQKKAILDAARAEAKLLSSMTRTERATLRKTQALRQSGLAAEELGIKIGQVTKRFGEYAASVAIIRAVQGALRLAAQGVVELDDAVQDLAKVGSVTKDIDKGFTAISSVALQTGRSIQDVSDAVGEFVRQGKDLETAAKAAAQALQLSNISALNGADAARLVTAAQQVFGSTSEDLGRQLSSLAVFADSSATNVTEIGQAFLRAASSAKIGGFSIEETFAVLAGTLEQTRLQSATVGTALKTIVARLGRDRNKVAALANSFTGLKEGQAGFVNTSGSVRDILNDLAFSFDTLTLRQKQQLALSVAGVRQGNVFIGMLDNFKKTQELVNNSQTDSSALNEKNEKQLKKLSTRFQNLQTAVKAFGGSVSGLDQGDQGGITKLTSDGVAGITALLASVPKAVTAANELFDGFSIGNTVVTASLGAIVGGFKVIAKAAAASAKQFVGIGQLGAKAFREVGKQEDFATKITRQHNSELQKKVGLMQKVGNLAKNARTFSTGEPTSGNIQGGAIRGAAGFAAADALNQFGTSLRESREEANKLRKEQGLQALTVSESRKSLESLAESSGSLALSFALLGKAFGAFALLGVAVQQSVDAIQNHYKVLSDTAQAIASDNIQAGLAELNTSIQIQSESTLSAMRANTAYSEELLRSISSTRQFNDALQTVTQQTETAFSKIEGVLDGLSPSFARLQAEIDTAEKGLSSTLFNSGGETVDPITLARRIATSGPEDVQGFNEGLDQNISDLSANEAGLIVQRNKVEKVMEDVTGVFEKLATDLRAFEGSRITSQFDRITKSIDGANVGDDVKKAVQRVVNRITAAADPNSTVRDVSASLRKESARQTKAAQSRLEKISVESSRASEARQGLEKDRDSQNEKSLTLLKNLVKLRKQEQLIAQNAVKDLDQTNRQLLSQNETIASQIQQSAQVEALRSGTLDQQKQAILLEKTFAALEDESLKKANQRVRALEKQKRSQQEISAARKEASKIESTLRSRAAIQAQPELRRLDDAAKNESIAKATAEIEDANKKVEDSDKKRVKALSDLQAANKKVLSSEKEVSSAGEGVSSAFLAVAAAQKGLSDAVLDQAVTIRGSISSALKSAGFENLANSGAALAQIVTQEERLSVIRREGLEESLRIAQAQASTLLSVGEKLATGGPGARAELQRSLSVAQSISGGAAVSSFSPDDIRLALQSAELFPGLREEISRQSLAAVGLEDELNALKGTIVSGTEGSARQDSEKQIQLAQAQLSASLEQVVKAENQENIARDGLVLAQDQAKTAVSGLDIARAQVVIQQGLLSETARQNRNILDLTSSLAGGTVRNAARGTLSGGEMSGLMAAAKREKSLMPAGSKLMLANTSETVLTAKQSRRLGVGARNQSNAANGNGDFTGLVATMNSLLSEIRSLRSDVQSNGVNNVNLQVDTNKNINVKGIEGLSQRLQSELQGRFASGSDVNAIETAILDIISKLGENGLADDLGR